MTFAVGYELTFTNAQLIEAGRARGDLELDTVENLAACEMLVGAIRDAIGPHDHAIEDDGHGFARHVICYPDGYWIKVEIDPWVLEITGKHLALPEYRAIEARFDALFAIAAAVGLEPHERIGGGHVHIARTSFGSELAIRNFIVDYCNHPELALGVLGFDPLNAPPLASAPDASIDAFLEGLAAFDAGQLDLAGFLAHLRARVYTFASPDLPAKADRSKYQALSVNHPDTIEIRAVRPHRSFAEFLGVAELFAARIAALAGCSPIAYRREPWPATVRVPDEVARERFQRYRMATRPCEPSGGIAVLVGGYG